MRGQMNEGVETTGRIASSYSARIDTSGRIVIPAELRDRLHVGPGDELVLQEADVGITVKSYSQVLAEAQAFFATLAPPGVSLVDELLADRRVDAAREKDEEADSDE